MAKRRLAVRRYEAVAKPSSSEPPGLGCLGPESAPRESEERSGADLIFYAKRGGLSANHIVCNAGVQPLPVVRDGSAHSCPYDNHGREVYVPPIAILSNGLEDLADDLCMLVGRKGAKELAERRGGHLTDVLPALSRGTREAPRNAAGLFLHLREAGLLECRRERPVLREGKGGRVPGGGGGSCTCRMKTPTVVVK